MGKSRVNKAVNRGDFASTEEQEAKKPPPELGGVLFWMVLGLAIADDLSDLVFTAINVALGASVVGIPIAIFLFLFGIGLSITVFILMQLYFISHGGLHASAKIKRFFLWFIAVPLEMLPLLQLLPMTTIMFLAIAWIENAIRKDNIIASKFQAVIDRRG